MQKLVLFCFLCVFSFKANAYELGIHQAKQKPLSLKLAKDSLKKPHSPHKAAVLSAVLPGAGQIYNKKYWKAGVVYAGLGVATYFMLDNRADLKEYKADISAMTDTNSTTIPQFHPGQSLQELIGNRDFHKRNRDYSIIAIAAIYLLNIADATVDAHLFEFNVDKNISGKIEPQFGLSGYKGARLTFNF